MMLEVSSKDALMAGKSRWTGVLRGLSRRCPNCGQAPLFTSYITVLTPCPVCGVDNDMFPSDDLPPYLTIAVVGHTVVPSLMWVDLIYAPPTWIEAAIWLPVATAMSLALLPRMKGASIGLAWASDIVREGYLDQEAVMPVPQQLPTPTDNNSTSAPTHSQERAR